MSAKGFKFTLLSLVFLISSCEVQKDIITNVYCHIQGDNVLRKEITFELSIDSNVETIYWNSIDTLRINTLAKVGENSVVLLGLVPETKYNYSISLLKDGNVTTTKKGGFETKSLPDNFPTFNLAIDSGKVFDGYISLRYTKKPARQVILNNRAEVVWYQDFDTTVFRPSSFTANKTFLTIENAKAIKEFDLYGNVIFELNKGEKGLDKLLHHEIIEKGNEILMLTRVKKHFDLSEIGGNKSDTVKSDGILVLDRNGNKKWEWSMFDVADPKDDPNILNMLGDWGHANSLNVDIDGHYLISFRLLDQVWKINAVTGKIIWKLGDGGDFEMHDDDYFFKQHAAHINHQGELMLFDNGNISNPISRSLTFDIDENEKKAVVKSKKVLPDSLHTFKMGSTFLLPDGNHLICASTKKKILIVNKRGNIVWMLECSNISYRAEYLANVFQ